MDIKEIIGKYIVNNFLLEEGLNTINDDDSLLDMGIIDSTGVLELVAFIEETFEIRVEDEELIPDNLDSVNRLVDYIKSKLKSR